MNLKDLTENKYTLNDIFTKHWQGWAFTPLFVYLLTPVIHIIIYTILGYGKSDSLSMDDLYHFLSTGEMPGDFFIPIIQFSFFVSAIIAVCALLAVKAAYKQNSIRRKPDNIPTIFFVTYIILIIISTIINKTDFSLLTGINSRGEGMICLIFYYLVFYLCGSFVNNKNFKRFAVWFFLATGTVIGILTIIDLYFYDLYIIGTQGVSGIFYHWNFYGYYLAISIPIAGTLTVFEKSKLCKVFAFLIFCLDTVVLGINDALGGFLAATVSIIAVIFFASVRDKKFNIKLTAILACFIAIMFVVGIFTPSFLTIGKGNEVAGLVSDVEDIATDAENAGSAGTARWTLWTHTWQYVKEKPWIGWGYEGTAERLGTETHADKTHNEYLENMASFGIPAGLIYLAALMSVYLKALKRRTHVDNISLVCLAGALGYIGSALVGNSFIFTAPYCFIFLGLGSTTLHGEKKWAECSCCKAKPESCNRQPD